MRGHEDIERILASYCDAAEDERARADAHVASCTACAARLAAFREVDAALGALPQPPLPPRLNRPLGLVIGPREGRRAPSSASGFVFGRTLAPAAMVVLVLLALSVLFFSINAGRTPATSTPTMTTTLTPTLVAARETAPAVITSLASAPLAGMAAVVHAGPVPTPAPAPVPRIGKPGVLLAGYGARATMIH